MDSLYFPIIENGMGLSRTRWAASLFGAGVAGILGGRRIMYEVFGHPDPSSSMNLATHSFLESGADRMIVIDTDVIFTPHHLSLLLSHDLQLVSGLYPKKVPGLEYPVMPLGDETPRQLFEKSARSPVEVACVPRGFLSVHRSVFETLKPFVESDFAAESGERIHYFWRAKPGVMSEDFAFCFLWREHGGKVWIDQRICCQHEGSAVYPIPGTFQNTLQEVAA
jgi:hypothetical protein